MQETVLDFKPMFDSECLFECLTYVYEAGVDDDIFALVYKANRRNNIAVKTPNSLSSTACFIMNVPKTYFS